MLVQRLAFPCTTRIVSFIVIAGWGHTHMQYTAVHTLCRVNKDDADMQTAPVVRRSFILLL